MTQKKTAPKVAAAPKPSPVSVEVPKTVILTCSTKERKGSSIVFVIPGVRGTVKVARSAFGAEPPTTLEVVGAPFVKPIAKMTAEERAAARAAMTPLDKAKAARERANRAAARAARFEAAAAAR